MKKLITIIAIFGSLALTAQSRPGFYQTKFDYNTKVFKSSRVNVIVKTNKIEYLSSRDVQGENLATPKGYKFISQDSFKLGNYTIFQSFWYNGQVYAMRLSTNNGVETTHTTGVKTTPFTYDDQVNIGYFHGFYMGD